jgi:glycerol-3-phosphate dehydrogenase
MDKFICGLNEALPGNGFSRQNVVHIFSGYLPAAELGAAELTHREVIMDHAREGGPKGLFSISGIKFTTSRRVAEKAIKLMFPDAAIQPENQVVFESAANQLKQDIFKGLRSPEETPGNVDGWTSAIRKVFDEESVRHIDDLVIRRLPLLKDPHLSLEVASKICGHLEWDDFRCGEEASRLKSHFQFLEELKAESLG